MSKITKRELLRRLEALEEWSKGADNMLTELNHALPDPEYDAKCEAAAAGVEASLDGHRERLGLNKPQLKQIDQSVFDGLDEKWQWAAVNSKGYCCAFQEHPVLSYLFTGYWQVSGLFKPEGVGDNYDASDWQNSLIERESKELTGSDLAVKYFESNERHICFVGEDNDECLSDLVVAMVVGYNEYRGFKTSYNDWFPFAQLVSAQGEPLTAADVGL